MPYLEIELLLPFNGEPDTIPRDCSHAGAKHAEPRAGSQAARLLALYREKGPLTDHEARRALRLPLSTVNARRAALMARGLVRVHGKKPGPWGTPNTLYGVA